MLTKMVFENGHFLGLGGPLSTECTHIKTNLLNNYICQAKPFYETPVTLGNIYKSTFK